MKISKNRQFLFILPIVLAAVAGVVFIITSAAATKTSVHVMDYGLSICTDNIPPSDCGPYEVNVRLADGQRSTYVVPGFDNYESKHYDEITARIREAREQNSTIIVKVNNKSEIITVE